MSAPVDIPLTPPSRAAIIFLTIVIGLFASMLAYWYATTSPALPPEKAQKHVFTLLLALGVVVVSVVPIIWALRRGRLTVTDTEITLRTGFYGRTLPLTSLKLNAAQEVSLLAHIEISPRWRTNGIALPGYRAGWFRLRNGDKALVYLTDPFSVTYLPTDKGYVLLVSAPGLLDALRQRAGSG